MQEVMQVEVLKLLQPCIIYPILDRPWVSPMQVMPKKSRITMVQYLKITQGGFRRVVKLFFFNCGFTSLRNFHKPFAIHFHQFRKVKRDLRNSFSFVCSLSCNMHFSWPFRKAERWVAKFLDVRFLLWFSFLLTWLIWKRLRSSPRLGFFMFWDSTSFAMNETKSSLILGSF